MNIVAEFKKVSKERFCWKSVGVFSDEDDGDKRTLYYDAIKLPERATRRSAGYDFFAPMDICLNPGESITFSTGIRCRIQDGWFMMIVPKSGLGTQYYVRLANTVGIVDADYYSSDNEGHIMATLRVEQDDVPLRVRRGEKIFQAIFVPYGLSVNGNTDNIRNGGHGSTGR